LSGVLSFRGNAVTGRTRSSGPDRPWERRTAGVLSAAETIPRKIPSTFDVAALCALGLRSC
jgi:hypothetical protein